MCWQAGLIVPIVAVVATAGCVAQPESKTSVRVKKIVADHLGVSPSALKEDARLMQDLKADSLDFVELIMAMEEEFKISIADDDAMKLVTVGDFVRYAEGHQK
jgi:acyl carrier protein